MNILVYAALCLDTKGTEGTMGTKVSKVTKGIPALDTPFVTLIIRRVLRALSVLRVMPSAAYNCPSTMTVIKHFQFIIVRK